MLDAILGFFSDLILFTAGLFVFAGWIVGIIVVIRESGDLREMIRQMRENGDKI